MFFQSCFFFILSLTLDACSSLLPESPEQWHWLQLTDLVKILAKQAQVVFSLKSWNKGAH